MHPRTRHSALVFTATIALMLGACSSTPPATDEADSSVSSEQAPSTSESDAAPDAPATGLTSQPIPADWPSEFLLPSGELVLVLEVGGGYQLLIEGIDEAQTRALLTQMAGAGLNVSGPAEAGGDGAWIAEVSDGDRSAAYAYASGGAGAANVTVTALKL